MENTTHRPNCREKRFVRPSHGGYVGHVTVKVLSESRQWMQGSSITEYDSMDEAEAKQRRHAIITAPSAALLAMDGQQLPKHEQDT